MATKKPSNWRQLEEIEKKKKEDRAGALQVAKERAKIQGVEAPTLQNGELMYKSTPQEEAFSQELQQQQMMNSPEAAALALRQQQESQAITALNTNAPQLSVKERNVQAGLATLSSISQTLGGGVINPQGAQAVGALEQQYGVPPVATAGLTVLGKVTGTRIMGFSLSDLFSKSNQGNIKNLQGDASKMTSEARNIAIAATSKGANVQEAIVSLNQLEEAVRSRYADAQIALAASPADIAEGLSLSEDLSYNLRSIVEQRQALERYQLTGNKNEVLLMTGLELPME